MEYYTWVENFDRVKSFCIYFPHNNIESKNQFLFLEEIKKIITFFQLYFLSPTNIPI
jgi:hypothetical protein